jgi:sugar phosphate permease
MMNPQQIYQTQTLTKLKLSLPWIIWILGASFYFYKYLLEVSPSVMGGELMKAFSIDGAQLGNLTAFYFYAYLIMQIPMGILLDRYGPRRVTTLSILLCAVGALILAESRHLSIAELGRFITGIGAAVAAISCMKLTTLWFPPQRFALMIGLMMTAGMLGAVSGQAPLSIMMDAFGWQNTLVLIATMGFFLTAIFWIIVRDSGTHASIQHEVTTKVPLWAGLFEILKKRQTWLLSLYSGFTFAPVAVFGGLWGVPYLQTAHDFTRTVAAEAVSLIFIGFAIGSPLFGWFSDYFGRRLPIMAWGTLGSFITITITLYWPDISAPVASILLFIFGFCVSSFLLCFSMIREINRLVVAATALGFMNAFDSLLGAVSDPFIGYLLDLGWDGTFSKGVRIFSLQDYHYAMCVIPIYLVIALALLPFIKETYCKQYQP